MEEGLVIVYTGDGKGKTTAALGLALRTAGYRAKVLVLQFIKGAWKTGELESAKMLSPYVEIKQLGIGFVTWRPKRPFDEHLAAAQKAWEETKKIVQSDNYDVIILDEINNATRFNLIPVQEVIDLIKGKPSRLHLVLTGREASQEVIDIADLVTEMKMIKHPFEKGKWARKLIDY
ncbi:MAG: cob(I)yrinic acid a,c-diamide adenosyltransferase [Thaumarchaeota archaeon]|nr:cob(I)yrinic acid a,c-diamide adenosyltransferase [Nitrososphaerota archaeon]